MTNRFNEVIGGFATSVVVNRGGLYKGKRYGKNSPDTKYIEDGLYILIKSEYPFYNKDTEIVVLGAKAVDEVNKTVTQEYVIRQLSQDELGIKQEELIKAKIARGEEYIKSSIVDVVSDFNTQHGVNFESIYNMAIYKDDTAYPLHTQCDTLVKWQNSMWATARGNQDAVIGGTMTEDEFIAALPTPPVV